MSVIVTEHTRQVLAQSMWDVAQHQDELSTVITRALMTEVTERPRRQVERSAALLVDLLISQAHALVQTGNCLGLDYEQSLLVQQGVDERELTPFGDTLAEAISTVVPTGRNPDVKSAWCDAFWSIVLSLPRGSAATSVRADRSIRGFERRAAWA